VRYERSSLVGLPVERLQSAIAKQPYRTLFVTMSGAHVYSFPSPDSDFDLRGAGEESSLSEESSAGRALDDLLVQLRLQSLG
jgi:hypothetical protein